jgi:hypothetical protein
MAKTPIFMWSTVSWEYRQVLRELDYKTVCIVIREAPNTRILSAIWTLRIHKHSQIIPLCKRKPNLVEEHSWLGAFRK